MRKTLLALFGLILCVTAVACQGTAPAEPAPGAGAPGASGGAIHQRVAGNWRLVEVDRFDANDKPLPPPEPPALGSTPSVGYIMYDPAGYMGVVIMREGRQPYSEGGPKPAEARAALATYTSYFGPYTINEAEGYIVHHVIGSLTPNNTGADNKRFYEFEGNRLILKPPRAQSGVQQRITWERVPEAELSPEQRKFVGFWRYAKTERRTADGRSLPAEPWDTGYIIYTPSGHVAVHLARPNRSRYAGTQPTDEEALAALRSYASYFGPFIVNENERVVVHDRIGSTSPAGSGTPVQRGYEFRDNTLILEPPPTTVDGQQVRSFLTWERLSAN